MNRTCPCCEGELCVGWVDPSEGRGRPYAEYRCDECGFSGDELDVARTRARLTTKYYEQLVARRAAQ